MSHKKKTISEIKKIVLVNKEQYLFEIPDNWVWTKLGYVFERMKEQIQPIGTENYIGLEHLKKGGGILSIGEAENIKSKKVIFKKNDILYGKLRPYLNKHAWVEYSGVASTDILVYRNENVETAKMLNMYLDLPHVVEYANKNSNGINLPRVSPASMDDMLIPLPPLAEQRRIVEKVERLTKKIDEAKLLIENIEEASKLRRAAILNRTFSGGFASKQRSEAHVEGNREKNKINLSNLPFNWRIVELREILQMQNGLSKRKSENGKSIPVLRLSDIKGTKFDDSNLRKIKLSEEEYKKYCLELDDILFIRVNGSFDLVGKAIHFNLSHDAAFSDHLIRGTFDKKLMSASYLKYLFESSLVRDQLKDMIVSSAGQNTVSQLSLGKIKIPLPPKKEVEQITNSLEKIFVKEEKLLSSLKENISQLDQMKQSILSKAFKGELGTNNSAEDNVVEFLISSFQKRMN